MSTPPEVSAFLGLGGNIGDPVKSMGEALRRVDADGLSRVVAVSSIYRTPPWGNVNQPDFLNCAAEIATARDPRGLLQLCLDIEQGLKRVRNERWGPRTVDLDVLVFGKSQIDEPGLTIPHPRMLDRAFVLVPLAEIAPGLELSGVSAGSRASLLDTSGIEKLALPSNWWTA